MEPHPHDKKHEHGHARGSLKTALIITATFLLAEFLGALYTNSLALLDGVFLVLVALYIFYEAYHRFLNPPSVKADWMLVVAIIGLLANLASAWVLFGKHQESLNVRGAFFHVLTDAIGSVGAIIASLAIIISGYQVADPLISALGAVLILSSSWILIRDAVDILLEATPSHINIVSLREQLGRVDGVGSVHDLHVWTLTSGVLAMSCHVVAQGGSSNRTELLTRVNGVAREMFRIDHTTIQIEDANLPQEVFESCNCHFGAWDSP